MDNVCHICRKKLSTRSNMLRHVRSHAPRRRFCCTYANCNKHFTERSTLKMHMAGHIGYKPHACDVCDKRFSQKKSLVFHKRVHSGESPYACTICDKRFKQKSNMDRHLKLHAKPKQSLQRHFEGHLRRHFEDHLQVSVNRSEQNWKTVLSD